MNIAIIYHSFTGLTRKLAGLIEAGLAENKHKVKKFELRTSKPVKGGSIRQAADFEIVNLPDLSEYDAICLGGPVWAFGPSTVSYQAIKQMPALNGKKVLPFVTMGFPLKGMGGRSAIKHMTKALKEKGAEVLPGIIVPKMFHDFEEDIKTAAEKAADLFYGL